MLEKHMVMQKIAEGKFYDDVMEVLSYCETEEELEARKQNLFLKVERLCDERRNELMKR